MNRHLAQALGATALGALLLQPVTAMADPPTPARNGNSAQHLGYSSHGQRDDDRWDDRGDDRNYRNYDRHYDDRRGWDSHYYPPRRGYVVHHLPPRHRVVHHHGHRYYYGGGAWYRPYGGRYVVVDPPAGPVYYVWNPRARGYVVTDRPYRRW